MARLIRTEKEVEGRFEEVWLVVEEDPLEQWAAGPRQVVGRPATRADALGRARGEALYTADLKLPGMLHTAVLRSPYARARATRVELGAALAAPGVRGAVGPGECERVSAECNFEGAAVAAVCADTLAQAKAALKLVEVEWERLEPRLDADDAVAADEVVDFRPNERGDLERGLEEADVVVEATYRTQVVLHNSMETHQSVCRFVGDVLEVYTSTQYVWGVRAELAETLGIDPDRVRVICEYMGGGFGSKTSADDYTYIAVELAHRTGRPVRCALSRREENLIAGNRNATIQRLAVGAREDGTLTALGGEFVNAIGFSGWNSMIEGPMQTLYACPNVRTRTNGARLNLPPMKAFRAPGYVEGTFGLECLLDELASKLGLDPLELRRRNHTDNEPAGGREYSGKELLECYRRAEPHWERRHEVRARSTATVKRGVGMASQIWFGGGGPPSYAWVRIGSNGHAAVVTAGQDVGTGTKTALSQIAAEELGLRLDQVTISAGDTARGPYATLSAGSSTIPSMGPAVRAAAADAGRQLLELAAQRFDADPGSLSLEGGSIVLADGERRPLEEIVGLLGNGQILGSGARGPNPAGKTVLTFGVQVVEVAVDVETGEVTVERVAAIHDVGRVINPLGSSSQLEGGIIQGIGHTLSEQRLNDPSTGALLTRTLDAYRLPTIADVPEIVGELVDIPDAHLTNLGSKGIGEPPIIPIAAAIANAIRDATGADVRSLPITREEMLRALSERRRKGLVEERETVAG
ncbi:MAG TPA: xanthine dehydrogenase family protein molybdopterin-binding subunit [Gaiellaceae bacterium]|nr:xanthine dehydrogenase family protein molybdopterin-binding subunit [Gaiellaceae bacterium]